MTLVPVWFVLIFAVQLCTAEYRECISTGAAGAQTCRSLGHYLLHLLILRLLVLCAPAALIPRALQDAAAPADPFPNAFPGVCPLRSENDLKRQSVTETEPMSSPINYQA